MASEHYCQYLSHDNDGVFRIAGERYEGVLAPCDAIARFQVIGNLWWFCAQHYDIWETYHDKQT